MGWGSFLTNLYNGKIRTHTDGRKWKYNSSKGAWKAETNETITQGNTGPTGPQGPMGPQGPTGPTDTAAQVLTKLKTVDGSGSGLDADLLDGQQGSSYLLKSGGTMTGALVIGIGSDSPSSLSLSDNGTESQRWIEWTDTGDLSGGQTFKMAFEHGNARGHGTNSFIMQAPAGNDAQIITSDGEMYHKEGVRMPNAASDAAYPATTRVGSVYFNTGDNVLKVYNGSSWDQMSNIPFSATGGTESTSGSYKYHIFTSSGTFTAASAGVVDVLVVAGGGGGGNDNAGGGGAGGLIYSANKSITTGTFNVTVGSGGSGATGPTSGGAPLAVNGNNSSVFSLTAIGGGRGGSAEGGNPGASSGGSGGGGIGNTDGSTARGSGTTGQGFAGGSGSGAGGAGGGGGAGAIGDNGSGTSGGIGGIGKQYDISGSNNWYAGGGCGGNENSNTTTRTARSGGGGSNISGIAQAGSVNTGGGGAGGTHPNSKGKAGGSGIVIIRYAV